MSRAKNARGCGGDARFGGKQQTSPARAVTNF
jgi:hypothetical protein